jgi:hypothetical protein
VAAALQTAGGSPKHKLVNCSIFTNLGVVVICLSSLSSKVVISSFSYTDLCSAKNAAQLKRNSSPLQTMRRAPLISFLPPMIAKESEISSSPA